MASAHESQSPLPLTDRKIKTLKPDTRTRRHYDGDGLYLEVTRSLSRPQVSDDNPFSESQFKTLKYHSSFPGRFPDIAQSTAYCRSFFPWW